MQICMDGSGLVDCDTFIAYIQLNGGSATVEELQEHLGISREYTIKMMRKVTKHNSKIEVIRQQSRYRRDMIKGWRLL